MCAAYTKIEACHIQAHEGCRIHACIIQHTYCICAHLHMLVCAAHTLLPYCMNVAYTKIGSAPHVYHPLQKCVLHIYCVQRNTHAEYTCAKCAQIAHVYTNTCCLHLFCMCAYCNQVACVQSAHFLRTLFFIF